MIVAEITKTVGINDGKHSQFIKFGELVKKSSRNGRTSISVEIAKTLNIRQDKHLQR